jgi:hypothetical protein
MAELIEERCMKRSFRKKMALAMVGGCLLLCMAACSSKADVSGRWNGKMTLPETGKSLTDLEFDLTQKGEEIAGTMIYTKVDGGRVKVTGTRTGDELKLKSEHKRGISLSFTGAVKSGSRISGTALLVYSDPKVPVRQDTVTLELSRK